MTRASVVVFVLSFGALTARADSNFWAEVRRPGISTYLRSMGEGRVLYEQRRLRDALVAFDRAVAALPDEADGHLWRGNTLYGLDDARGAIDAWDRARELEPSLAEGVRHSFDMAIALAKAGEHARTIAEYERIMPRLGPGDDADLRAQVYANCAESQMALGRDHLEAAVRNYRRALVELGTDRMAYWGLAVALDRQGSIAEARAALSHAVADDATLAVLRRSDVFFVPPHEIHAYLALGHESVGRPTVAADEWRLYLAEGGAAGPWRDVAERHLTELGGGRPAAPASSAPVRRSRPRATRGARPAP